MDDPEPIPAADREAGVALSRRARELDEQGWVNWSEHWPYSYTSVYICRIDDPTIHLVRPEEIDFSSFSIAGLWWMPF